MSAATNIKFELNMKNNLSYAVQRIAWILNYSTLQGAPPRLFKLLQSLFN